MNMKNTLLTQWDLNGLNAEQDFDKLQSNDDKHYFRPQTLEELDTLKKHYPEAQLVAGGTDLVLKVTQNYQRLEYLIDISRVEALNEMNISSQQIVIGAATTYARLEKEIAKLSPQFSNLLQRIASRQIRNRGTVGGNIANASPIADLPPFFLSIDAGVNIRDSEDGNIRNIPLKDFYLDYKKPYLKRANIFLRFILILIPLKIFIVYTKLVNVWKTIFLVWWLRLDFATMVQA